MELKAELQSTQAKLRARMAELRAEIEAVKAPAAPKWIEVDQLIVQQQEIGARIQALTDEANGLEQPKLHELKMELAQVARTEIAINLQLKAMG